MRIRISHLLILLIIFTSIAYCAQVRREDRYLHRAIDYYLEERLELAEKELLKVLKLNPKYEKAKRLLKLIKEERGEIEEVFPEELPREVEYTIGPEDELEISVWGIEELTKKVTVRPDGKITYKLIGEVYAQGLTLKELDDDITKKLSLYIKDPEVTVIIEKFGGEKILVLGQVSRPGVYKLTGGARLLEAIAMAGDFTDHAVLKSTLIVRGTLKEPELIKIDAQRILRRASLKDNILLHRGDIIYVPKRFIANVNYWWGQVMPSITSIYQITVIEEALED